MADVELVIKIPEEQYNTIKSDYLYNTFPAEMKEWGLEAIKNGIVLPKGHGRLIDADIISLADINFFSIGDYCKMTHKLTDAPTIIEKAESEDI